MGGGIGMGNTCKPMAVSFQCMTKFTTKKKKKKKRKKRKKNPQQNISQQNSTMHEIDYMPLSNGIYSRDGSVMCKSTM